MNVRERLSQAISVAATASLLLLSPLGGYRAFAIGDISDAGAADAPVAATLPGAAAPAVSISARVSAAAPYGVNAALPVSAAGLRLPSLDQDAAIPSAAAGADLQSVSSVAPAAAGPASSSLPERVESLGRAMAKPASLESGAAALDRFFSGAGRRDSDDVVAPAASGSPSKEAGGPSAADPQVAAQAQALHREYEKTAAARLDAWQKEVAKVQSGRFGLAIGYAFSRDGKLQYELGYVLEGKPLVEPQIENKIEAGEVTKQEWSAAKPELDAAAEGLLHKLVAVINANDREHAAVHQRMDMLVRTAAAKKIQERLAKGEALQAWGLPIQVPVNQKTYLRYAKLYRLNGMPTDLGNEVYDLLAPKLAADPQFLSKLTRVQFDEAVQHLFESLKYRRDLTTEDGQKLARMMGPSESYDYPEMRKALHALASQALTAPPLPDDTAAGLTPVAKADRVTAVIRDMLTRDTQELKRLSLSGASDEEMKPLFERVQALAGAAGMPVRGPDGQPGFIPIRHRQLLPILAELRRRGAAESTVEEVIRSFPLGESLWRLGVHKLWERGITGKGVKVAVLDNGVDFDHPDYADLKDPIKENFTRDRGVHTNGAHGTPMASIIHAIAPDAEIQSYQILSNTQKLPGVQLSEEELTQAIMKGMDRAVANGANVISMSFGGPMAYANDSLSKKIAQLAKKGVIFVGSAGNSGDELPKGYQVGSPATSPEVIAVGAVDYHGKPAPFSSEGLVFNPTKGTVAEKPEIYAFGVNVKAAARLPKALYAEEPVPYEYGSGTSPAAPHVSGTVALMLSAAQQAGASVSKATLQQAIRTALMAGVRRIGRLPVLSDAPAAVQAFVASLGNGQGGR